MDIDNQYEYWNAVAQEKTFSHPVAIDLVRQYADSNAKIIDYGCGYGRVVQMLLEAGFSNVCGYDTSIELTRRGQTAKLPIYPIPGPSQLPLAQNSVDLILLFAVLTCIPSNAGQTGLIHLLHSTLKPGGYIYTSDYYLQDNEKSRSRYTTLNDDPENFGVFELAEGATFRHHTREWIATLFKGFRVIKEMPVEVRTMNGNPASAFQLIVQKI